jgi:hypothetical protein
MVFFTLGLMATYCLITFWLQVTRTLHAQLKELKYCILGSGGGEDDDADAECSVNRVLQKYEAVATIYNRIESKVRTLFTMLCAEVLVDYVPAIFSLMKTDADTKIGEVFAFFFFSFFVAVFLCSIAQLNSAYTNIIDEFWFVQRAKITRVAAAHQLFTNNPLQFELFGVTITWSYVGGYIVTFLVTLFAGISDQLATVTNSGVF